MVRKVSAAIIVSLGVALVPIANQAFAGSARALLPVAAWGTYGGLSVGPYGGLNIGPYSSPFAGLYVDANRFTCTYDIPWDWAHRCPPIANPPEPPLAPAARAPSCAPQPVTVPGVTEKIRRLLWFAAEKAVVTARRPHRRVFLGTRRSQAGDLRIDRDVIFCRRTTGKFADFSPFRIRHALMKVSRSAFIVSACVVGMPCGKPL